MPFARRAAATLLAFAMGVSLPAADAVPDRAGPWEDEAASIAEVRTLTGHRSWVRCLAFADGGDILLSGSDDHTVKLWRMPVGETLGTLTGHFR